VLRISLLDIQLGPSSDDVWLEWLKCINPQAVIVVVTITLFPAV